MDNQKIIETQDEAISRELMEERDERVYNILRDMSDFLNRYSVEFPLPWIVDAAKQVEEFDDDKKAEQ